MKNIILKTGAEISENKIIELAKIQINDCDYTFMTRVNKSKLDYVVWDTEGYSYINVVLPFLLEDKYNEEEYIEIQSLVIEKIKEIM